MFYPHPRQNKESRVVSEETNVPPTRLTAPADVAIATANVARRRRPCQAGDRPALRPYEVFQVFADRLFVAQVMMFFHQAIEQRLVRGTPHLLKLQWLQVPQSFRYR